MERLLLLLVITQLARCQSGWMFNCQTMDIASQVPPLDSFPQDITTSCVQRDKRTISVSIESVGDPPLPYSGIMVQIWSNNRALGSFLTQRSELVSNSKAVGTQHQVTCEGDRALVSTDLSPKFSTTGRWYNSDNVDLSALPDLRCLISLIDVDENSRYIRYSVEVTDREITPRPQSPPRNQFEERSITRPPTTRPTTTQPTTTTTERDLNAGPIQVDGIRFPHHCIAEGAYRWVPLPHTGCNRYLAVTSNDGLPRAAFYCPRNAACFDTKSCMCRRCNDAECTNLPITSELTITIYDAAGVDTGILRWSRVRQPGQATGFTYNHNTEGLVNPHNIRSRPVYNTPNSANQASTPGRNNNRGRNRINRPRSSLDTLSRYLGSLGDFLA